jgi:cytochrome c biogenesis protein CcdA
MASLGETYERRAGGASQRRVYLGTGLFATGALLVVAGILAGTTGLLLDLGFGTYGAREVAGILAGLGVPAVFLGVFTVLPANQFQRAAAAVGGAVSVAGVMLFRYAYPEKWYVQTGGAWIPSDLVLGLTVVYFAGLITTFWCLFTAVATFKTRNDPGGTVTLTVTKDGQTRTVEVARSSLDDAKAALGGIGGGIGVFGNVEDTSPQTPDTTTTTTTRSAPSSKPRTDPAASPSMGDGGSTTQDISSPMDQQRRDIERPDEGVEMLDAPVEKPAVEPDRYCGSCAHFDYVQSGTGMQPYCGLYEEEMQDMEACDWWESSTQHE